MAPARSSPITLPTTSAQSPATRCRNSRAVGYHGVRSDASIQRQSERCGSRIQVGLPIAPARCAMQVSVVITKSSVATSAAVSARSRSPLDPSRTHTSSGMLANCSAASPFCNEIQFASTARSSGTSVFNRIDRAASALYFGFPAHEMPTRNPGRPSARTEGNCFRFPRTNSSSAPKYAPVHGIVSMVVPNTAGKLISGHSKS